MRLFEIGRLLLLLGTLLQGLPHTTAAAEENHASGDQPAGLPSIELPPALDRVLRDYERAWQARDPAALATLFAEDGFVLANGSPPVRGRDAIRTAYAHGG